MGHTAIVGISDFNCIPNIGTFLRIYILSLQFLTTRFKSHKMETKKYGNVPEDSSSPARPAALATHSAECVPFLHPSLGDTLYFFGVPIRLDFGIGDSVIFSIKTDCVSQYGL